MSSFVSTAHGSRAADGTTAASHDSGATTTAAAAASGALPPNWTQLIDPSQGVPYYCNTLTGETQWERPQFAQPVAKLQQQQQAQGSQFGRQRTPSNPAVNAVAMAVAQSVPSPVSRTAQASGGYFAQPAAQNQTGGGVSQYQPVQQQQPFHQQQHAMPTSTAAGGYGVRSSVTGAIPPANPIAQPVHAMPGSVHQPRMLSGDSYHGSTSSVGASAHSRSNSGVATNPNTPLGSAAVTAGGANFGVMAPAPVNLSAQNPTAATGYAVGSGNRLVGVQARNTPGYSGPVPLVPTVEPPAVAQQPAAPLVPTDPAEIAAAASAISEQVS